MDFIERWFGVSPDGGNGAVEVVWICVAAAAVILLINRERVISMSRNWIGRRMR